MGVTPIWRNPHMDHMAIHKDPSMTRAPCRSGRRVRSHLGLSSDVGAALRDTSYRMLLVQGAVNISNLDIDFVGKLDLHFGTILLATKGLVGPPCLLVQFQFFLMHMASKPRHFGVKLPHLKHQRAAKLQIAHCASAIHQAPRTARIPPNWQNPTMTGDNLSSLTVIICN